MPCHPSRPLNAPRCNAERPWPGPGQLEAPKATTALHFTKTINSKEDPNGRAKEPEHNAAKQVPATFSRHAEQRRPPKVHRTQAGGRLGPRNARGTLREREDCHVGLGQNPGITKKITLRESAKRADGIPSTRYQDLRVGGKEEVAAQRTRPG